MIQDLIVILIVGACAVWLGMQAFRYLKPRPGKGCAGGCCDGAEKNPAAGAAGGGGERTMMISSDDLRARLAARKK